MALPSTRKEFKEYVLRDLGYPVIEINVSDDQVEDRIDESLKWFQEYHYDATEKLYYKHQVVANNYPDRVYHVVVRDGGTGYANTDTVTFSAPRGTGAVATVNTYANGTIATIDLSNNGAGYTGTAPTVAITGGSGANVEAELGGFIQLPENIIGAVKLFNLTNAITNISNIFSIQYQIALNEIWSLSSYSLIPYYTTLTHLSLVQQLLVGEQPIRFSRHRNRVHIDMAFQRIQEGQYLIVEAYEVIDPNIYYDVWKDRWLLRYCAALVKKQWGGNMKKYGNMTLPSGIVFNGKEIYDEAEGEIQKLEDDMIHSYSIPNQIFIGPS